jgi:hypothetical protein
MQAIRASAAIGAFAFSLSTAGTVSAQTMEPVRFFADSIAEKEELVVRLSGGSSWVLASRTRAAVASEVMIVLRDVTVSGQHVLAAWLYHEGEEIPVKHVEGVYPQKNAAYLTRVVAAEGQGAMLRLADGTELSVPRYDRLFVNRWVPPYKALLTGNRIYLYNLKVGRRVSVQAAKASK